MSFIQAADIVKGIQICLWIHENCFQKVNNADTKYQDFKQDVSRLKDRLKQIQSVFDRAHAQSEDSDLDLLEGSSSLHAQVKKESEELIGDFNATLEECQELLRKHVKYSERRKVAFLDNAFWHLNTQKRVEHLRSRIQFHTQKIYLLIEPVQLSLVTDIAGDVSEILDHVRRQTGHVQNVVLPEIPPSLDPRFYHALLKNPPKPFVDAAHVPLKEGFDALYEHFRHSTIQFKDPEIGFQTVEQYLNLLKAHWLVETLKHSASFEQTRPGSLYRKMVAKVEQRIEKQYSRPEITKYSEEQLGALNDAAFLIWPEVKVVLPPPLDQAKSGEEKLFEASLSLSEAPGFRKRDIIIFRVSDKVLRLVLSQIHEDASIGRQETESYVNLDDDGLVPWYTLSPSKAECRLAVTNGKGAPPKVYELKDRTDGFAFQRAFVGYEVASFSMNVTCTFTVGKKLSFVPEQREGFGETQIWQCPAPAAQSMLAISPTASSNTTRPRSTGSGSTYTTATNITKGKDPTIISMIEDSEDNFLLAKMPPPPLLIAFTRKGDSYTMWHTEISGFQITESPKSKPRSVLERFSSSGSKKSFLVRSLAVKKSQLSNWNLSGFVLPRSPVFNDPNVVESVNYKYLALDFPNLQERDRFNKHLKLALKIRADQADQIRQATRAVGWHAQKPRVGSSADPRRSRATSVVSNAPTSSGIPSTPPRIDSLSSSPDFSGFRRSWTWSTTGSGGGEVKDLAGIAERKEHDDMG